MNRPLSSIVLSLALLATHSAACGRKEAVTRDLEVRATNGGAASAAMVTSASAAASTSGSPATFAPSASVVAAPATNTPPTKGRCVDAGTLLVWRYSPSATLLPDGRVMVAGGRQHDGEQGMKGVEMWDAGTQTFQASSPLSEGRTMHRAVVLKDGRVLLAGGRAKLIEIYNPKTDKWRKAGRTRQATVSTFVAALSDGRAIIAGGDMEWKGAFSDEVLVLDPATSLVTEVGGLDDGGLAGGFTLPRPDGSVVLLGWSEDIDVDKLTKKLTLRPDTGKASPFVAPDTSVEALTRLPTGASDAIGYDVTRPTKMIATGSDVQRFDAKAKTWEVVATYARKHEAGAAAFLDDHRVLVLGGLEKEHAVAELCSF